MTRMDFLVCVTVGSEPLFTLWTFEGATEHMCSVSANYYCVEKAKVTGDQHQVIASGPSGKFDEIYERLCKKGLGYF